MTAEKSNLREHAQHRPVDPAGNPWAARAVVGVFFLSFYVCESCLLISIRRVPEPGRGLALSALPSAGSSLERRDPEGEMG